VAPSPSSPVLCSSWATVDDIPEERLAELQGEGVDTDPDALNRQLLRASEILWALSGRTWYGAGCEEDAVLRAFPPSIGTGTWPYHESWGSCGCWVGGNWLDGRFYPGLAYRGVHAAPFAVALPRSPVVSVEEVLVDGEPFTEWNLIRSGWIERTDGRPWQVCGDATVVTYRYGEPPPQAGIDAAIELGTELAREGLESCRLPPNVVSVTRQNVTMEIEANDTERFRTGLYGVDLWLDTVNPYRRPQPAQVWSPDVPRLARSAHREV